MTRKSKKAALLNTALTPLSAKQKLGLMSLEPRLLLDAAGFVTGAEVAIDVMSQDDAATATAEIFENTAVKNEWLDQYSSLFETEILQTSITAAAVSGEAPTLDLDANDVSPIPGQNDFTQLIFTTDPVITNDGQSEEIDGVGNGETGRYANVGTINGQSIDLVATVVRFITDTNEFSSPGALNGDNPLVSRNGTSALVTLGNAFTGTDNDSTVEIIYRVVQSGTDIPVVGNFSILISDIDNGAGITGEEVAVYTDSLDSFVIGEGTAVVDQADFGPGSDIVVDTAQGVQIFDADDDPADFNAEGIIRFRALDGNVNSQFESQANSVQLNFTNTSDYTIIFHRDGASGGFLLNGGFSTVPFDNAVTIDTNAEFANIYTEGEAPVAIAANTIRVSDDIDSIDSATIVITNAQANDVLAVTGTLPAGIVATLNSDNSITLSGNATADAYEQAILAITFANTSDTPNDTVTREIDITVIDSATLGSNTATSFIQVIDVPTDTDGDGVVDSVDVDDDNDGILDVDEGNGGTFIGQFDYAVDEFDTDGVFGFSSSVAELDGQEITTGQNPGQEDGDRSPLLSEGDVITFSLNEGTLILAVSIDSLSPDAEIGIRYQDPGGNPNFELRGVDDAINAEESAGLSLRFFDATDSAFAAANGFGDIAQIISAGGGDPVQVTSSIRISDIDLDGRLEGVSASLDSLASYTIEGDNGSFTPVVEDDLVVFRGTVVNPTDNVQLNFLNTDALEINLLNNQDSRAGFSFNFSQFNFNTAQTTTTGLDSDGDGIDDHLDIDSDNDGITDNIEAQSTAGYIAPNADDAATLASNNGLNSAYIATNGLTVVDTDSDGFADYIDTDSDNDGLSDTDEAGLTGTATGLSDASTDADGDGLFDVFDTQNGTGADDGFDVNESITAGAAALPDTDGDASGNVNLIEDVDFRDAFGLDTDGDGVADADDIDDDNDGILDVDEMITDVFAFTGSIQTFTVPAGVTQIEVGAYGAGGGDGFGITSGGAGGFTGAILQVTAGDVIEIIVGEGGERGDLTSTFGGGGAAGDDTANTFDGASGGGRSAIRINGVEVLTAGGGGGGSSSPAAGVSSFAGAGGGLIGQDATHSQSSVQLGHGGSQIAGGEAGGSGVNVAEAGTQFQGGEGGDTNNVNSGAGGGGGGGFFGGSGGGGQFSPATVQDGAGGGGSSFVDETIASEIVILQGNLAETVNTDDPNYVAGVAVGGDGGAVGGNGLVYIRFAVDSDTDGVANHLDIDSDNDGVTDNVEAQTTEGYIAPNADDAATLAANNGLNSAYVATNGLTPVNTDGTDTADFIDTDSDNDGLSDALERGDGQQASAATGLSDAATDADGDGLFDVFEGADANDGFDVNDENRTAAEIELAGDAQLADDGRNADGLRLDSDFRDADTDNDGVVDSVDVDDDNDGILDVDEFANIANFDSRVNVTGTVDVHRGTGTFGVTTPPFEGDDYIAFHTQVTGASNVGDRFETWSIELGETIEVGQTFTVRFHARVLDNGVRNWDNPSQIFVAGGTSVGDESVTIGNSEVLNRNAAGWVEVELEFTATSDISHLTFYNVATGNFESYVGVDALQVEIETDSDGDGINDHLDIDSDNDGITDNIEAQSTAGYIAPNADDAATYAANDGLNSAYVATNGLTAVDTDSDGNADFIDTDSDNEGAGDTVEAGLAGTATGLSDASTDADGDGLFDVFDTQNGTGADDGFDVNESITAGAAALPDTDGDASGNVNLVEDVDFRDALGLDTDGDGVADAEDIDDDNDGILDVNEGVLTEQVSGQLQFNHNENNGFGTGGTFVEFGGTPRVSDVIASAEDSVIGSGLTVLSTGQGTDTASQFEFDLEGADSATFDEAVAADDYIELSFTTQDVNASLRFLFHSFVAQDSGGSNRGDYRVTYLISDDGFASSDVLVDDFQFQPGTSGSFNGQFPPFEEYILDAETRYSVRVYVYDAQNDVAGQITFDDQTFEFNLLTELDEDGDGIVNRLDIDSDNDGITDNIEAQTTDGYIAPNDDDAATLLTNNGLNSAYVATNGLAPVDTDNDGQADYLDTDSDNDGLSDNFENGLGLTSIANGTLSDSTTDADGDGLFDQFETAIDGDADDGFVVNEGINDPLNAANGFLPDVDSDAIQGSIVPLSADLDFRDVPLPPVLDLNSTASAADSDRDFTSEFTAGTAAVSIVDIDADALNGDRVSDFTFLTITPSSALPDGANEILQIAGVDVPLNADITIGGVTIPGTTTIVDISYVDGVLTVREASNGAISNADMDALIRSVTYRNEAANLNDSVARTFDFQTAQFDPSTFVIDFEELTAGDRATSAEIGSSTYYGSEGLTSTGADTLNGYVAADGVRTTSQSNPLGLAANADGNFLFHNTAGVAPAGENVVFGRSDIPVEPNTDYTLSLDLGRVNSVAAGPFEIVVNGTVIGTVTSIPTNTFQTFTFTFSSGEVTSADFEIRNLSANPTGNDFGIDNITFQRDPLVLSNVATATVDLIAAVAPEAQDDAFEINENPEAGTTEAGTTEAGVVTNGNLFADNGNGIDSDVNGDTLSITQINGQDIANGEQITLASGALLTIRTDGTFDYDPNGAFDSLDTNETATETFTYTLSDGTAAATDTATVTITVDGDNDAPTIDLNGPDVDGTDFSDVFVEDEPGQPLANLLSFDAVIEDDEDNISVINIIPSLPIQNDGTDEFLRIDSAGIELSIRLIDGEIVAGTPLVFGDTTFVVTSVAGVVSITNADGGTFESDDLEGFLRLLAYENLSQNNSNGIRAFNFQVVDPAGVTIATSTITVDRVNDAPVVAVSTTGNGTVAELGIDTPTPSLVLTPDNTQTIAALTGDDVRAAIEGGATAEELGLISVADLLAQLDITDVEEAEFAIGVILADETQGVFQYVRTGEGFDDHEFTDFQLGDPENLDPTPVPDGEALLLASDTFIRFLANPGFLDSANLTFRISDLSVGTASNPPSTVVDDSGGVAPTNTSSLSSTAFSVSLAADTDGDGVINADDVDDDNDGILDVDEGFQEETTNLNFEPDALNGADIDVIQQGDVFVYRDAITRPDGSTFDITLTFDTLSLNTDGSVIDNVRITSTGAINIGGFDSGENDHVTVSYTVTAAGSSTDANPSGTPVTFGTATATASDFDFVEGGGFAGFDTISAGSNLVAGTLSPPAGFTVFESDQSNNAADPTDPNHTITATYSNTSTVQVLFGLTAGNTEVNSGRNSFFELSIAIPQDSDGDGIADHLDIDSDDDGITDNIEAQSTDGYIAPSGTGAGITDVNQDGLDDNYDTRNGSLTATSTAATATEAIIIPQDTDGLGNADFIDPDSDDDGILDVNENGLDVAYAAGDTDGDGLADVFEAALDGNVNDGFVVNEGITPLDGTLPDSDGDAGGVIVPGTADLDYRDILDTDGDGVTDRDDIDDDNDGILDVVERDLNTYALDFSSVSGGNNVSSVPITTDTGQGTTNVTFDTRLVTASTQTDSPSGAANGDLRFGVDGADLTDETVFRVEFSDAVDLLLSQSAQFGNFDIGEQWTITAIGGGTLTVTDPDGELNIISDNGTGTVEFSPTRIAGHTDPNVSNWSIATSGNVTAIEIRYAATTDAATNQAQRGPIRIEVVGSPLDSDGDGVFDHLDIDSDNDGITDNVEAQTTAGYIAPSGQGGTADFIDVDGDGLDDNYDADTSAASTSATSAGLTPVNTDAGAASPDATPDYLDTDSDNDGLNDTVEAGLGTAPATGLSDAATDTDGDGLFDVFEDTNINDGFDVNDTNLDVTDTNFNLPGVPALNADGSNAVPLVTDLDFRDINDAPVVDAAIADTIAVDGETVSIASDFSDPDGDIIGYSAGGLPAGLSINPLTGEISGEIDNSASQVGPNNDGVYTITVTANDSNGGTSTDEFTLTVTNPAPVVDTAIVDQAAVDGETISITPNFVDPDGDVLGYTAAGLPAGLSIDALTGEITGTIDNSASQLGPNSDGVYTIAVTAFDNEGGTVTDTFEFTVTNPAPDAIDDALSGTEDAVTTANVITANDVDPDGDTLTVSAVNGVAGNVGTAIAGDNGGLFTIDANGELSFDPNGDFEGLDVGETAVSTVTYEVSDGEGGFDTATVTMTIMGVNDAPIVTGTFAAQSGADSAAQIPFDASTIFSDPDGEALSFTSPDLPAWMSINPATGVITGTPPADASQGGLAGEYVITIVATDPDGESVSQTINYNFINPAPVVDTAVANQNAVDGEVISIPSSFVDPDGDVLGYIASGLPAGLSIDPVTGEISGRIDNSASQTNGGVYIVAVTANDSEGGVVTDTFAFTITNPAPDAMDDALTGDEDTVTTGNVITASDSDPDGDELTVSAVNGVAGNVGTPIAGDNGGLFTIDANGELSFDPNGEFEGLDVGETAVSTVTYEVSDGEGGFDTATVAFTVTGLNDAPIVTGTLAPQAAGMDGTAQIPFDASTAFSDPDGEALSFTSPDLPAWMSINPATGVITGTPPADASQGGPNNDGVYTVTVIGTDADGEAVSTTVNYTFTNPAPIVDTTVGPQAAEDGETVSLVTAISDPDGDDLAYTASGLPAGLTIDPATGEITGMVDPSASQNGPNSDGVYTITVTADDGEGGTVTDTFDLTITNPAPIAEDDTVTASEDTVSVTGSVFDDNGNGADVDPDGDTLVVSEVDGDPALVGQPIAGDLGGVFTIESDGSYTFETNGDFEGLDVGETATTTVTYQVSDGEGGFDTATIEIEVTGENDAPVLIDPNDPNNPSPTLPEQMGDDSFALTSFDVSEFFVDPDGELNLYNIENAPSWLTIDNFSGVITGTPPLDASQGGPNGDGTYPITIVVTDFDGAETREIINYTIANPAPTATDDFAMAAEDGPGITGNVISADNGNGIDSDPDGDTLFVEEVNGSSANVGAPIAGSTGGLFTVNADGSYSFDPNGDFENLDVGETRDTTITYLVSDGEGGTDLATVTVTIDGSNDAPIVIDPLTGLPPVDANAIIPAQMGDDSASLIPLDVTPFFTDVDIEPLSFSSSDLPAWMMIDPDTGVITGTPPRDASQGGPNGDGVYVITITATDPDGETVSTQVSYTIANPAPIAQGDVETTDEDTVLSDSIFPDNGNGADIDPDGDDLVVTQVNGVAITSGGVITLPSGALLTINADGSYDYDPNGQFEGLAVNELASDSFTYQISDNEGGFDTATVSLTITGTNDAPIPVDPSQPEAPVDPDFPVDPDDPREAPLDPLDYIPAQTATDDVTVTPLDLTPFFGDPDGSDTITLSVDPADLPLGLTFDGTTISGTPDNSVSQGGPNGDGVYTVAVTATDPSGESFTTFVTYTFANPAPVVDTAIGPITAADAETVSISSAISDPDGDDLAYSVSGLPAGLTIDPVTGEISGEIDNSASQAGPNGDGVYTVTVTADDGEGGTVTDTFELTVTNPAPIAADDVASATEDAPVSGNVITGSDVDPDGDVLSVAEVNGDPALVGQPVAGDTGGLFTINSDGSYTFEPNGDFEGLDVGETAVTTITYLVTDSEGGTSPATITITVTGENDAPIVTGTLTGQTSDDSVAQVPFDASTVFSDVDGEPLSFSSPNLPPWMTIDPVTGIITGTPPADASQGGLDGVYEVTVIATDPDGEMVETTVTYTFTNPAPVVDTAIGPITAADAETVSIPSAISDPDGDTLAYSASGLPAGLTIDPVTGEITGEIDNSASIGGLNGDGVYTVTVTADDGQGGTVTDTFELTVTNPAPVVGNDSYTVAEDTPLLVNVLSNDSDPDGDAIVIDAVALPDGTLVPVGVATEIPQGTLTVNADGSTLFEPRLNFFGPVTFGYTVSDGQGGTDVATVTIDVTEVNDGPIPVDPSQPVISGESPDVITDPEDPRAAVFDPSNFIPLQTVSDGTSVDAFDLTPFFGDPDPTEILVISLDPSELPLGLTFDPATGIISGTPDSNASQGGDPNNPGTYVVAVTVTDPSGETFTTNITYVVENLAPEAANDGPLDVAEDTPTVLDLTGNDTDADGDDIVVTEINGTSVTIGEPVILPSGATVTLNPDGTVEYTPVENYNGPDGFTYTVSDGEGGTDTAEVSLDVTAVNDAPQLSPLDENVKLGEDDTSGVLLAQTNTDGEMITPVDISAGFIDVDDTVLTFTATGLPPGLTLNPETGIIEGTLSSDASVNGPYNVTITATDAEGGSVSTDFVWSVENVAPVVDLIMVPPSFAGEDVIIDLGNSVVDPDGDTGLIYSAEGLPPGLVIDPNTGVISGVPTVPQADPYVVTLTVDDGQGGVTTAEFSVQINEEVYIGQDVTQEQLILEDGVDPYAVLEDAPIELQNYFHDRALESRDANGRMFGDRDFRGGMIMSQIPGYDAGYLIVEAVAYEHNINVQLATTLDAFAGTQVQSWNVSLANGAPMPDWVGYVPGADFMDITRPLNQESIELRIRALLDNGQTATTTAQINLSTGAVTELGQALSQAQTLDEQLTLETQRLAEGSSDLLQALAS